MGRSLNNYHQGQNRLSFKKINLIYCQLKIKLDGEIKRQKLKRFSPPPSSQAQLHCFIPDSLTSSFRDTEQYRGMGKSSCSEFLALHICHFSLAPAWVLSWAAVLRVKPTPVWPLHSLQFIQNTSVYSGMVSIMGCSVDNCISVVHHVLQGDSLLPHGLHRLQRNLWSSVWNTSSPCSAASLTLSSASLFLTLFSLYSASQCFFAVS